MHPTRTSSLVDPVVPAGHWLARLPPLALAVGVVSLGLAFLVAGRAALPSYLVAFLFWLSLALGGLFFVLLQHATRAGWSVVVRRLAEHVMGTLPLFVLLFLPVAVGLGALYPWVNTAPGDTVLAAKRTFLNPGAFYLRAAVYLAAWSFLAVWFRRQSLRQDREGAAGITRRLQAASAPALLVYGVTVTFAAFDWLMSLEPHWYSTMFGVYFFSGAALGIFALLSLLAIGLTRAGLLRGTVTVEHLHDLGKLLFAFTVFWAYIGFSQFMLIWYANIPEETVFFAHRWQHGWEHLSVVLAAGHFGLPFFFLLPRAVKRRPSTLGVAAAWLLVMHALDLYWLVMPTFRGAGPSPELADGLCLLGVGGLFAAAGGWLLRGPALVPLKDPRLLESLRFESS